MVLKLKRWWFKLCCPIVTKEQLDLHFKNQGYDCYMYGNAYLSLLLWKYWYAFTLEVPYDISVEVG